MLAHHWGRCGFRSAWADDEAVCPPYRAVGAERVAGVRRPILPDCASLHPCYAGLRRVGKRPFDKLRTGFLLAHHWGECGFRSAWADGEAVCPPYRAIAAYRVDVSVGVVDVVGVAGVVLGAAGADGIAAGAAETGTQG